MQSFRKIRLRGGRTSHEVVTHASNFAFHSFPNWEPMKLQCKRGAVFMVYSTFVDSSRSVETWMKRGRREREGGTLTD